jgi:hypothetical protein
MPIMKKIESKGWARRVLKGLNMLLLSTHDLYYDKELSKWKLYYMHLIILSID